MQVLDTLVLIERVWVSRGFRRDALNARIIGLQVVYETPYGPGTPKRLSLTG